MESAIILAGIQAQNGTLRNARAAYLYHDYGYRPAKGEDICERNIRHRLYGDRLTELCDLCGIKPEYWELKRTPAAPSRTE
jgi:hypothetical protein